MEITPAITDTPLLKTGAKSPAETTKKCMGITPAITELLTLHVVPNKHFYCFTLVTTDTRDNEHLALLYLYNEAKKRHFTFMLQLYVQSLEIFGVYFALYCIIMYHSNC